MFTASEVRTSPRRLVSFRGGVFDVTDFAAVHPGGDEIHRAFNGPLERYFVLFPHHLKPGVLEVLNELRVGSLEGGPNGSCSSSAPGGATTPPAAGQDVDMSIEGYRLEVVCDLPFGSAWARRPRSEEAGSSGGSSGDAASGGEVSDSRSSSMGSGGGGRCVDRRTSSSDNGGSGGGWASRATFSIRDLERCFPARRVEVRDPTPSTLRAHCFLRLGTFQSPGLFPFVSLTAPPLAATCAPHRLLLTSPIARTRVPGPHPHAQVGVACGLGPWRERWAEELSYRGGPKVHEGVWLGDILRPLLGPAYALSTNAPSAHAASSPSTAPSPAAGPRPPSLEGLFVHYHCFDDYVDSVPLAVAFAGGLRTSLLAYRRGGQPLATDTPTPGGGPVMALTPGSHAAHPCDAKWITRIVVNADPEGHHRHGGKYPHDRER